MIQKLKSAITKKYKIIEVIGNGSYGVVSKAQCLKTGIHVALKIMKNKPKMEYELIKLIREIKLQRRLNKLNHQYFGDFCFVP